MMRSWFALWFLAASSAEAASAQEAAAPAIVASAPTPTPAATVTPSPAPDLVALHERVAYVTVQVITPSASGTGWLLEQSGRPIVVTHRQLAERADTRGARVLFYGGPDRAPVEVRARLGALSHRFDLGVLRLEADPPATARAVRVLAATSVTRGQRIVLGGTLSFNGMPLPFQTLEGTVSGHAAGRGLAPCSGDGNCVAVDVPALAGSSGGPAFDTAGQLVGMLWAGTRVARTDGVTADARPSASLAWLIPARVLAEDLARFDRPSTAAVATPPALPTAPPQEAVARVLNAARAQVAACGSTGTVRVDIVVQGTTGQVTRIGLDGVPFDSAPGRCVRTAVGALRFPRFSRDSFRMSFPYHLARASTP